MKAKMVWQALDQRHSTTMVPNCQYYNPFFFVTDREGPGNLIPASLIIASKFL
jgi:hypothetical protein